jgi:DDE domain
VQRLRQAPGNPAGRAAQRVTIAFHRALAEVLLHSGMAFVGIVKLTVVGARRRGGRSWPDDARAPFVPSPALAGRDHPARRVAVSRVQPQPARGLADPGRVRRGGHPRKYPKLMLGIPHRVCQTTAPPTTAPGDTWHLDEVFVRIRGVLLYLWRAVDRHGSARDPGTRETRWRCRQTLLQAPAAKACKTNRSV